MPYLCSIRVLCLLFGHSKKRFKGTVDKVLKVFTHTWMYTHTQKKDIFRTPNTECIGLETTFEHNGCFPLCIMDEQILQL